MSKLLTEKIVDNRDTAVSRSGIFVRTKTSEFLELSGGSHASCIVHDDGAIVENLCNRMKIDLFPLTGRTLRHRVQEELAELVISLFGDSEARVYFTSGGTESVETAIRLAYHIQQQRGRAEATIVVGHEYSYHGMSLLTRNAAHHPIHSALPKAVNFSWPKLPEPRCNACPLGLVLESCGIACASVLEEIISVHKAENIAAVILEPISGTTGGALVPPPSYISHLSRICRREGILLIADETVTAFWRTGREFVVTANEADIVVGGKCLGSGWAPIGCVILSSQLCDELKSSRVDLPLRLTFAGNPLACLVALTVQRYIIDNGIGERVKQNSSFIEQTLVKTCPSHTNVYGTGHLWGIEVPIKAGLGESALQMLKAEASLRSLEFMGGFKSGKYSDSVHILLTPPFDATRAELIVAIDAAATLVGTALTHVIVDSSASTK